MDAVATVVSICRYPVKSMMGEELNAIECVASGLLGDRAYALLDRSTGRVVSAKNPKRWPSMFRFRAAYVEPPRPGKTLPPVRITLPDGAEVRSDAVAVDTVLSAALGADVTLQTSVEVPRLEEYRPAIDGVRNEESVSDELIRAGTFFDAAPVHLLTTATIDALRAAYPQGRFEARRFRPNVVLTSAATGFAENKWHSGVLSLGEARLRVEGGCPRCVMTTLPQGDLPHDLGILRTAANLNQALVGIYCSVATQGRLQVGDVVSLQQMAAA